MLSVQLLVIELALRLLGIQIRGFDRLVVFAFFDLHGLTCFDCQLYGLILGQQIHLLGLG